MDGLPKLVLADLVRIVGRDDSSLPHHDNAVALMKNFLHLVRDQQDGESPRREGVYDLKNSGLGADIDADRGGVENQARADLSRAIWRGRLFADFPRKVAGPAAPQWLS